MSSMVKQALCLVALLYAVVVQASSDGPVEKVVKLLEDLKDRIGADMKDEQKLFDKYACWCEAELGKKAKVITETRDTLKMYGSQILKLKGEVATLTSEIEEEVETIKSELEAISSLTGIRQKENAEYMAETSEMQQALAALEKAIEVLFKATKLLQEGSTSDAAWREAAPGVRSAIAAMPASAQLPPAQMKEVAAFLEGTQRSVAGYAPQSATIQGILKDLYDDFAMDLERTTNSEATKNKNFEDVIASKMELLQTSKESLTKKEEEKAEAEVMLAEVTEAFAETEKQMKWDIEFFDATKPVCQAKAEEWGVRKSLRKEELAGIEKALEILTSDDAKELFGKAIKPGMETSFLQVHAIDSEGAPVMKAYRALKSQATKTHSLRLAALAAAVRTTKVGHFDKVIEAIDKMMGVLKDEEASDIAKRDECKVQFTQIESDTKDIKWKIEKNIAKIDKLEGLIKQREDEKVKTLEAIEDVEKQITSMEDQRKEENTLFLEAKSDDEGAIKLLEQAKEALSAYYEKNKIEIGPVQGSVKFVQLRQPEFEVSEHQAPDATFDHKGSRKGESKGIISILTMIIEDLHAEIKTGMQEEAAAQRDFEKNLEVAKDLKATLEEKVVSLTDIIAKRNEDLTGEKEDKEENQKDLDDVEAHEKDIKPDCDWILEHFEERREKRKDEMDGLVTAKDFLAGYQAEPAMLQAARAGKEAHSFLQRRS